VFFTLLAIAPLILGILSPRLWIALLLSTPAGVLSAFSFVLLFGKPLDQQISELTMTPEEIVGAQIARALIGAAVGALLGAFGMLVLREPLRRLRNRTRELGLPPADGEE
jgi:hypothetical protein